MSDISQPNWSPTDSSNNSAAPDGAPEGMAPSGVNNTMRAIMGATKRFWSRINGVVAVTNASDSLVYTPAILAPSLADGEIYTFRANANNAGATTLNVGVGGALPVVKMDVTGTIPLVANDIVAGGYYQALWSSVDAQFVVLNIPPATIAPASVSANIFAALHSVSACLTSEIASLSVAFVANLRSISIDLKADLDSVSGALTTAFNSNDDSTSAVIKADMNSLSAVHVAMLRSVSAALSTAIGSSAVPANSCMFFWGAAAPTGWTFISADDYTLVTQAVVGNGGGSGGTWTISGMNDEGGHTHTFSAATSGPSAVSSEFTGQGGTGLRGASTTHTHTVTAGSGAGTAHGHTFTGAWRPKHLKVILCSKN